MKLTNLARLLLILLIPLLTTGCIMHRTNSTEIGVRTRKIGLFAPVGVEEKIYPSGATYFFLPFINDWHTFDKTLQNLEMTYAAERGDRFGRDDLRFKTIDGNDISLDVIISYRIIVKKAPYILANVASSDQELRQKIVRTVTRSRPRDIFGELETESFYKSEMRAAKAELAKEALNKILNPYGVEIERVLTKDYRFNEAYQKAIEDKKIADQKTEQNKSEAKAKEEEYLRKLEEIKGDVNKMVANIDGEYEKAIIEADAYYEKQKDIAKAIKAEGAADAIAIRKMNEALAEEGGAVMVKLKIADALKGKRFILLPTSSGSGITMKTLDLNQLLNIKGLEKLSSPAGSKKTPKTP